MVKHGLMSRLALRSISFLLNLIQEYPPQKDLPAFRYDDSMCTLYAVCVNVLHSFKCAVWKTNCCYLGKCFSIAISFSHKVLAKLISIYIYGLYAPESAIFYSRIEKRLRKRLVLRSVLLNSALRKSALLLQLSFSKCYARRVSSCTTRERIYSCV